MNLLYGSIFRVVTAPTDNPQQVKMLLPALREERAQLGDSPAGNMLQAIIEYWEKHV